MKKFILSFIVAVTIMVSTVFFFTVSARVDYSAGGIDYYFKPDGTAEVVGFSGGEIENLVIPSSADGHSVKSIGLGAFQECSGIITLSIPGSVTQISSFAFSECDGIEKITIPGTVGTIKSSAFQSCASLSEVIISNGVKSVNSQAFSGCSKLEKLIIPGSVNEIGARAFEMCSSLYNVSLGEGIETIGNYAFDKCGSLSKIKLPSSLQTINLRAFSDCTALEKIILPGNVSTLGRNIFTDCDSLAEITFFNESCLIESNLKDTIPAATVIFGYKNSTAEEYAEINGREFHEIYPSAGYSNAVAHVKEQMKSRNGSISFTVPHSESSLIEKNSYKDFFNSVFAYNPEEANGGDYLRWSVKSFDIEKYVVDDSSDYYTVKLSYYTDKSQEEDVDGEVSSLISSLNLNISSDYEKIRKIFLYLSDAGIRYSKDDDINFSAYSVLKNKCGTCEGLSLAFYRLALACGIESRIVVNQTLEHMWNIVRLDGKWYYLDITLAKDDSDGEAFYFLKSKIVLPYGDNNIEYSPEYDDKLSGIFAYLTPFKATDYPIADSDYIVFGECNHVYEEGEIHGIPCNGTGTREYHCNKCNKTVSRRFYADHIDADNNGKCDVCGSNICPHEEKDLVRNPGRAATCTENGYTESVVCTRCNSIIKSSEIIIAAGHIDKDGDGVCDNCGEAMSVFKRIIAAFYSIFVRLSKLITKLFGRIKG